MMPKIHLFQLIGIIPDNDENFEILVEYLASPSLEGKTLILADPMLATGRSFMQCFKSPGTYG